MRVNVKLFAVVRDRAGTAETELELPASANVAIVRDALAVKFPAIREHLHHAAFAVNRNYAGLSTKLEDGDEVAVIPPVSGG